MQHADLDRLLSEDEAIVPSPAFAATVMSAVMHAASAPQPLAFPWRRALPGLICTVALLLAALAVYVRLAATQIQPANTGGLVRFMGMIGNDGAGWIALTMFVVTLVAALSGPAMLAERSAETREHL